MPSVSKLFGITPISSVFLMGSFRCDCPATPPQACSSSLVQIETLEGNTYNRTCVNVHGLLRLQGFPSLHRIFIDRLPDCLLQITCLARLHSHIHTSEELFNSNPMGGTAFPPVHAHEFPLLGVPHLEGDAAELSCFSSPSHQSLQGSSYDLRLIHRDQLTVSWQPHDPFFNLGSRLCSLCIWHTTSPDHLHHGNRLLIIFCPCIPANLRSCKTCLISSHQLTLVGRQELGIATSQPGKICRLYVLIGPSLSPLFLWGLGPISPSPPYPLACQGFDHRAAVPAERHQPCLYLSGTFHAPCTLRPPASPSDPRRVSATPGPLVSCRLLPRSWRPTVAASASLGGARVDLPACLARSLHRATFKGGRRGRNSGDVTRITITFTRYSMEPTGCMQQTITHRSMLRSRIAHVSVRPAVTFCG